MSAEVSDLRVAERAVTEVAVKVVDCDVHPYPSPTNSHLVAEHTPEPWRTRFFAEGHAFKHGSSVVFDPPEYFSSHAMREDTRPPTGGFPNSDPDFALEQLIRGAGVDIAILGPMARQEVIPEDELARCAGYNGWLAEAWLGEANDHGRWRGSICATLTDPVGSAAEIERWADHPMMVQALVMPEIRTGFGDPRFDPVFEAATRHGLPIATHVSRGPDERLPLSPVGPGSWYVDVFTPLEPMLYASHLTSLVFDGAFARHPNLRVIFIEGAFTWVLPLMWRLDEIWRARRGELPHVKRPPSEYIREHVHFTTQPIEDPEERNELIEYLDWMKVDDLLLFSTDYPHWSYDDPAWAVNRMPRTSREKIMHRNAQDLLGLPETVPALKSADV